MNTIAVNNTNDAVTSTAWNERIIGYNMKKVLAAILLLVMLAMNRRI